MCKIIITSFRLCCWQLRKSSVRCMPTEFSLSISGDFRSKKSDRNSTLFHGIYLEDGLHDKNIMWLLLVGCVCKWREQDWLRLQVVDVDRHCRGKHQWFSTAVDVFLLCKLQNHREKIKTLKNFTLFFPGHQNIYTTVRSYCTATRPLLAEWLTVIGW